MKMRLIAAAALAYLLAACSAGQPIVTNVAAQRDPVKVVDICDPTIRNPYLIRECQSRSNASGTPIVLSEAASEALQAYAADSEARLAAAQALAVAKAKLADRKKLSPLEMAVITKADLEEQRAAIEAKEEQAHAEQQRQAAFAEYRARAECSYKAQEANSNSFGLVHGFFAGLGTGSACINYYREIGVIR